MDELPAEHERNLLTFAPASFTLMSMMTVTHGGWAA